MNICVNLFGSLSFLKIFMPNKETPVMFVDFCTAVSSDFKYKKRSQIC